jgi:hypothetical protein
LGKHITGILKIPVTGTLHYPVSGVYIGIIEINTFREPYEVFCFSSKDGGVQTQIPAWGKNSFIVNLFEIKE